MNAVATPYAGVRGSELSQTWRHALAALVLLLLWTLLLYRDTGSAMVAIWSRSDTFAHAFLVPPIVLWLVWRQRLLIGVEVPRAMPVMLVFVAVAALAWLLGELAAVNALTQLAFVALLVLTVPAVLGWPVARLIIFPLGFLFFAVPMGEFLMPQLMEWTANFTVLALRLSGVPVYREGLQFVIPSGHWSVVEACSGVRYLIASLTVGALYAYLNYQSTQRRVLFVMVSLLVPIVANWMRAYIIVMLGHLSGNELAVGVDHLIYGWLFFGVVMMLMFVIGARWTQTPPQVSSLGRSTADNKPAMTAPRLWAATAGFAALMAVPHVALWALESGPLEGPVTLAAPAGLAPGWRITRPLVPPFKPAFQNPSAEMSASYVNQGEVVGLYLAYYRRQDYSQKLVSSNNVLVRSDDPQWARVANDKHSIDLNGQQEHEFLTVELRGSASDRSAKQTRLMVWQIYWINGTLTASDYLAKAYSAFYRLTGRGDDSAVIVIYAPKERAGDAAPLLESFLTANYPSINALLLAAQKAN
ncbi:MAG: exosortase A [Gammaproteobacteria bacterium]|uniref:exosortase A n=1 Tax=Rhodoferax sp. TaxID=50421 RepID=UPI001795E436|nr:exosortase A [Rhodoferax sp.]MBU3897484.1 exosortase A [Gammaproteobacteria bacterium]MBA3058110.1 exosortase A [Rhodoferax sp.]MBU3996204.1 exosortase A [Gammaproteobacteria bacterium]MBU4018830.1 exosortase A [Gammaproteobacteria bacterium]MBU4079785.1 exosortase A [Gammaproteobacteria bacterium]